MALLHLGEQSASVIVVVAITLAVAGTFMPWEFAVLLAGPVSALAYGPMTVAISVFYFTGVERLNASASESGLIDSPGPAVTA